MKNPVLSEIHNLVSSLGSQKAAAEKLGISPMYLCDLLRERMPITTQIGAKLGYEKRVTWRKVK